MKSTIFRFLFLYIFFYISHTQPEGFSPNTLVKNSSGFSCIQQLRNNDTVLSYIPCTQHYTSSFITQIIHASADSFIRITIKNSEICCASDQLFYCYNQDKWIRADELTFADFLINDQGNSIAINSIECIQQHCKLYALALKPHHTYCISEHNIMVHNIAPAMIVCFSSAPSIAPVAQACIAAGLAFFGFHFSKKSNSNRYASDNNSYSSSSNHGSYYPNPNNPNDPDDKNKNHKNDHPHVFIGTHRIIIKIHTVKANV